MMPEKPWSGRFSEKTNRKVEAFTASIDVDQRLYRYDIEGSIAHCRMLAKAGVISADEATQIIEGLGQVKREIEHQTFHFDDSMEDIHMHIEARLTQLVGKAAYKLHTARSRNDQVALDVRLYLRAETRSVMARLLELRKALVEMAQKHETVIMPGYTHLQRAQPVLLAHHLLAYYEMFTRDSQRFADALKRIDINPLGSAALAGTTYPIDRAYTSELMGFPKETANSIDTVADRDFVIEFLADASLCMLHLSRLSEELVLWSSSEFGFIELPDAFATGSSIMPQKKNPDVAELVRGKTGGVFGDLVALLTMMKGLPLAYNRDLQEDKKHLFSTADTLQACIDIFIQMLPPIKINADAMLAAASQGYLDATDMADYLVAKGIPFRQAHALAGRAVSLALEQSKEIHMLSIEELKNISSHFDADIYALLTPEAMVKRRASFGGTAPQNVRKAIETAQAQMAEETGSQDRS